MSLSHTFPVDHRHLFDPNRKDEFGPVFVLSHQSVPVISSIFNHTKIDLINTQFK